MQRLQQLAWICTGSAPSGSELASIQLQAFVYGVAGVAMYVGFMWLSKTCIKQKWVRISAYILLSIVLAAATAYGALIYGISTCGT